MTRLLTLLCLIICFVACKSESKDQNSKIESISEEQIVYTVAEKIAQAHGIDNWKNVTRIDFTFNVDRGDNHFERSWTWKPKTDDVRLIMDKDTINYNRASVDSLSLNADKSFINDKYWLLAPFQLVWDEGATISEPVKETPSMTETALNKITLTYGNEGGYTPGDAYDFYYGDHFLIKEWVYRKGNSTEPSMITSFENYEDFNGIKIAKDHKKTEGDFNLYFSNIKIQ